MQSESTVVAGGGEERQAKKARSSEIPSSVISVFLNEAGERAGPPIDLPVGSTAKQLQGLINSLLSNEDKVRVNTAESC